MSVTIELPPDIEAGLAAIAEAQGISLPEYLRHLFEERVYAATGRPLSPAERATAWRDSVRGLPDTPPLSDEAISRESIYSARG
jgi:hypothetical protein